MLKIRSTLITAAIFATLSVFPIATSQADNSTQQAIDVPWTLGYVTPGQSPNSRHGQDGVFYPTLNSSTNNTPSSASKAAGTGTVRYHVGGSIIANPKVYVIWYGGWDPESCSATTGTNSTASILTDLVKNIGGSDWNGINTTYFQNIQGNKTYVSSSIVYSGCVADSGSLGLSLDSTHGPQVSDVVKSAIQNNSLPSDQDGVYLVLTASNVTVNGFLSFFCGYHSAFASGSTTIKYSFIGDASASIHSCVAQPSISPNGNVIADGMANVLAHELIEPISDPLGISWFDESGLENADKCAWTWGSPARASDGSFSNTTVGNRKFLIQQNVAANSNFCVSSLPNKGK